MKRNKNRMKFKDWWYYNGEFFVMEIVLLIASILSIIALIKAIVE